MAQTTETAVVNNTMVIANSFKEKAGLGWYNSESAIASGNGKAVFKKAAQNRINDFLAFDDLDKAVKAAEAAGDETKVESAKEALAQACKGFTEGGRLHEIQTRAYGLALAAGKSDPLGQTPLASLGIGLSLNDEESFKTFKEALVQAVIWTSRQVKNEASQAAAKVEAEKAAKEAVRELTSHVFDDLQAWNNPKASDKEILNDTRTLILRSEVILRKELLSISEEGSGSVARSIALLDFVEDDIYSELEQNLSDRTLHLKDREGAKIWQPGKVLVGTTSKKIIEAALIKLRALHSKVDRSIERLNALEGAAKIVW